MAKQLISAESKVIYLPLELIVPNRHQPRKFFNNEHIEELALSIKEYGVMQPISVRRSNGTYELVAGERRFRASKLAGHSTIPALIINVCDKDSAMLAIIENIQRENLNFIEEAMGFAKLISDFSFTQDALAKMLGKNQSTIANKLRVLKLPQTVKEKLLFYNLSERHGRALLKLPNEQLQLQVVEKIAAQSLNVKNTENLIESMLNSSSTAPKAKPNVKIKRIIKDIRLFSNSVKQSLDIMQESGFNTEYIVNEVNGGYEVTIKMQHPDLIKE